MANSYNHVFNRANVLLAAILLIVRAVNCQGPSCGYVPNGKQGNGYEDNMMKIQSAEIVNQIQLYLEDITELTHEYLKSTFGENRETFFNQWKNSHKKPLDFPLSWDNFQDRPDITRSEYTSRVQQVFVPFNRVLHHLKNITEHAKTCANTIQSSENQAVAKVRAGIKKGLNSVLCPMYQYLAMADNDLHIETAEEIDQHSKNSASLQEEVVSGLLYVYLTETMGQFLNSSRMFADS